jgi:glycosyltransferase involved in cell wall biosynthesis
MIIAHGGSADQSEKITRETRCKITIFAEYQGDAAVSHNTTGFQRHIEEWINQARGDNSVDFIVYCMGLENKVFRDPNYPNVTIKQYSPNLSILDFVPFVSPDVFPFLVDVAPIHLDMIDDVIRECPDIIHTFQTFGATDLTGLLAAKLLRIRRKKVKLFNTITSEIDSYFGVYVQAMARDFFRQLDDKKRTKKSLGAFIKESSQPTNLAESGPGSVRGRRSAWRVLFTLFWYTLAQPFHWMGKREIMISFLSKAIQGLLKLEIAFYLRCCDAIIIQRPEDKSRYGKLKPPVYRLPLGCDPFRFYPFDPNVQHFAEAVKLELLKGNLSSSSAEALCGFAKQEKGFGKRPIVYVGRLSSEKNIDVLTDAYDRLLGCDNLAKQVHLVLVGAGAAADRIIKRFGEHVTAMGLVPNSLLPWVYNLARQRNGYFVSASDTETFGLTFAEAVACGVPIIAMHKGTRHHVMLPGDKLGGSDQQEDEMIAQTVANLSAGTSRDNSAYRIGLNGLVIPDYSQNRGLSVLAEAKSKATETLAAAMGLMGRLPEEVLQRMSGHALRFSKATNLDWSVTWSLMRKLYAEEYTAYKDIIAGTIHDWEFDGDP